MPNGYQIALACGPLKKARYINATIEKELAEFKEEITEKCEASEINKTYVFPRNEIFIMPNRDSSHGRGVNNNSLQTEMIGSLSNVSNFN